jgi:hypothetical protein
MSSHAAEVRSVNNVFQIAQGVIYDIGGKLVYFSTPSYDEAGDRFVRSPYVFDTPARIYRTPHEMAKLASRVKTPVVNGDENVAQTA